MIHRRYPLNAIIAMTFLVLISLVTLLTTRSERVLQANLLKNGDFEQGFHFDPACGLIGNGWNCFTNDDAAIYGAEADVWPPVVHSGRYSQLLAIEIRQPGIPPNRIIGVYQTVSVVPGQTYTFHLNGILRANDNDPDPWRYRVEWGYTRGSDTNWKHVAKWQELPWNHYDTVMSPGPYRTFSTSLKAPGPRITLFVRLRAKWGTWPRQIVLNLDDLALEGPGAHARTVASPSTGATPAAAPTSSPSSSATSAPGTPPKTVGNSACQGTNMLTNGGFEAGFEQGVIARGWTFFNNNQLASYSFHDDSHYSLGATDLHGQFIGINTQGFQTSTPHRYAGISQVITGLTPGASYTFCLQGILKVGLPIPVQDPKEFRAEWALVPGAHVKPTEVKTWVRIPWPLQGWDGKQIHSYAVKTVAPARTVTLFIRLWKESAAVGKEGDLIVRAAHLGMSPRSNSGCLYTVRAGDTLGAIALAYHTTVSDLVRRNRLTNPNLIFVGQKLQVPCTPGGH